MQRSTQDSDRAARRRAAGIDRDSSRFYLVGGGIASMAAAAFLIRDGAMPHDAALERHAMQHSRRPGRHLTADGRRLPTLEHPGDANAGFQPPQPLSASSYSRSPNPT
ncbi:oleate hydratase [Burkholderia sp. Bp9004]|uniref:oleate hydratase n=1 Tax=Burkholderia sp. Bp9004 TaxID=2184559 RepID=UPI0021AB94D4|nr:oleate hydratase [Burkholderia sp. Bp9004]